MAVNAYGQRQQALEKRMGFARAAVLWTALAVEAGANYYIAATLPGDQVALDDLKTVNKLLVAPRLATGQDLFATDVEPIGQLRILFRLRNRIVHPKVGKHAIVGEKGIADFTPHAAGECLIAAARAISILAAALPSDDESRPTGADLMLKRESDLRAIARRWTEGLPKPKPKPRVRRARPPLKWPLRRLRSRRPVATLTGIPTVAPGPAQAVVLIGPSRAHPVPCAMSNEGRRSCLSSATAFAWSR